MMRAALLASGLLAIACASPPRPAVLGELDAVRTSSSADDARRTVPLAGARAEKLRAEAEAAWPEGQTASSEILAERALVAYADARELTRIVRAEQRLVTAKTELHQAELELQKLEAQQTRAAAEAADLDAQLSVVREAEVSRANQPASPDREAARKLASRTAVSQARLLCVSASLLSVADSPAAPVIAAALKEMDTLEAKLASLATPAPMLEATSLRARCQQLLSTVRRPARVANPTSEAPDRLFVDLAQAGFAPSRDDRGIVVTLAGPLGQGVLDTGTASKLAELGRLAKQHEDTPLLVVAHAARGEPNAHDQARADAAANRLRDAGASHLTALGVGGRLPIALDRDLKAAGRNPRLEVIFVTRL